MQRFMATKPFEFENGAIGWAPGGPMDCLGPYAKVQNCPLYIDSRTDAGLRRTAYATGHADTYFSVPAVTRYKGRRIVGFFTYADGGGCIFIANADQKHKLSE